MKNQFSMISLLVMSLVSSTHALAEHTSQYQIRIFNLADQAVVNVTENGQPVKNVPIEVTADNFKEEINTADSGSAFIRNTTSASRQFTITVKKPNGENFTTHRFISSYN